MFFQPIDSLKRDITLLEIKIHLESLISQIQLIAFIVLKPYKEIAEMDRKEMIRQAQDILIDIDGKSQEEEVKEEPSLSQKYWQKVKDVLPLRPGNFYLYHKSVKILRKDEWLVDFPKGPNLISYLYNILISLESDLSVINLVRKLFQSTINPYLNFITTFIYEGDFEDPFNEFFIEKITDDMEVAQPGSFGLVKLSDKKQFKMKQSID